MRLRLLFPLVLLGLAAPALGQPTVYLQQLLSPDPAPAARFGASVALGGDYVVVGEPGAEVDGEGPRGRAFLFLRDPDADTWTLDQELEPSNLESDDEFPALYGSSVSMGGLHALVGAPYDSETVVNSGAAFLFQFDEETTTWNQFAKFKAPTPTLEEQFGHAVSISGSVAVVGAYGADEASEDAGAAYVYVRNTEAGAWNYFQTLTADDAAAGDHFGFSVAAGGNTIVVGRPDAAEAPGAAYVFEVQVNGEDSTWVQTQKLEASDGEVGDGFGHSVGISPGVIIVGAPFTGTDDPGAAYVFEHDGEAWEQTARLVAEPPTLHSSFGAAVSVQEDLAVVGAPQAGGGDPGSAYVYTRVDGTWTFADHLEASTPEAGDAFGASVAVNADVIAIGSPQEGSGPENTGAAYVFGMPATDAEDAVGLTPFHLGTPHPNPATTAATVPYTLDEATSIELAVYDVLGREVATLARDVQSAGQHEVRWSPSGLPAGVYFVRLRAGDASATRKLVVVR